MMQIAPMCNSILLRLETHYFDILLLLSHTSRKPGILELPWKKVDDKLLTFPTIANLFLEINSSRNTAEMLILLELCHHSGHTST